MINLCCPSTIIESDHKLVKRVFERTRRLRKVHSESATHEYFTVRVIIAELKDAIDTLMEQTKEVENSLLELQREQAAVFGRRRAESEETVAAPPLDSAKRSNKRKRKDEDTLVKLGAVNIQKKGTRVKRLLKVSVQYA